MPYLSIAMRSMPMPQAAAENFPPILTVAKTDLAFVAAVLNVDFERRLGEGEERRPKPHADAVDLEEGFEEFFEDPLHVAEMRTLIDDEALDLMKHRRMRLIAVAAIGAAGNDDAGRRLLREHGAHLHRRGMRAQ